MLVHACDSKITASNLLADLYKNKYEELLIKLHAYYIDELTLRGDKTLNREYLNYFSIEK